MIGRLNTRLSEPTLKSFNLIHGLKLALWQHNSFNSNFCNSFSGFHQMAVISQTPCQMPALLLARLHTRNTASVPCICFIANLTSFSATQGNSSTPLCIRKHLNPLIPAFTMGLISAYRRRRKPTKTVSLFTNKGTHNFFLFIT